MADYTGSPIINTTTGSPIMNNVDLLLSNGDQVGRDIVSSKGGSRGGEGEGG